MNTTTDAIKGIFILCFLALLTLPSIGLYLHQDKDSSDIEKRALAAFPELTFHKELINEIEAYIDDHFGWRSVMLDFNASLKLYAFASSPQPEKVQLGKNRWLYYVSKDGGIYDSYTNGNKLTEQGLERFRDALQERTKLCKGKGRRYISAVWPNKHSVYPEFMNQLMRLQIEAPPSRLDQLRKLQSANPEGFELYAVTERLLLEKKRRQVYHKNDSHWNDDGAYFAFEEFMSRAFPEYQLNFKFDELNRREEEFCKGDLLSMMGIATTQLYCEKNPVIDYPDNCMDFSPLIPLKILVFGDSYFDKLLPLFNCSFKEVVLLKGYYSNELIEEHQPDIVLSANVERNISL